MTKRLNKSKPRLPLVLPASEPTRLGKYRSPRNEYEFSSTPPSRVQPIAARMYHGSSHRPTHHLFSWRRLDDWRLGYPSPFLPAAGIKHTARSCRLTIAWHQNILFLPLITTPCRRRVGLSTTSTRWLPIMVRLLAGDSAGGNLTLSTAASLPDEPRLRGCMMIYPATQHYHAEMRSYTEHAKSGPLTSIMRWFMDTYLDGLAPANPQ